MHTGQRPYPPGSYPRPWPGTCTTRYRQHSADYRCTSVPQLVPYQFYIDICSTWWYYQIFGNTKIKFGHMSKFLFFVVSPGPCTYNIVHGPLIDRNQGADPDSHQAFFRTVVKKSRQTFYYTHGPKKC